MYRGTDGVVKVGAPAEALGKVQNWNIDESGDTVSGWGMGDDYESTFGTIKRWTGSVEVYLDAADPSYDLSVHDEFDLNLYPGGEVTGTGYFSGLALVTDLSRSASKDGIPTLNINFMNKGALTSSTVA